MKHVLLGILCVCTLLALPRLCTRHTIADEAWAGTAPGL